jgi:uncharacterized protein YyaL (SSP411 family)
LLLDVLLEKFADQEGGGFFYTASDHEELIARTKELTDSSTPSGNALAATALLRLGRLSGRAEYLEAAERTLAAAVQVMQRVPLGAGQMLLALDRYLGPAHELVLVGDFSKEDTRTAIAALHQRYLPRNVLAARDSSPAREVPQSPRLNGIFAGKVAPVGEPALYVCQDHTCQAPAVGLEAIESQLAKIAGTLETTR